MQDPGFSRVEKGESQSLGLNLRFRLRVGSGQLLLRLHFAMVRMLVLYIKADFSIYSVNFTIKG